MKIDNKKVVTYNLKGLTDMEMRVLRDAVASHIDSDGISGESSRYKACATSMCATLRGFRSTESEDDKTAEEFVEEFLHPEDEEKEADYSGFPPGSKSKLSFFVGKNDQFGINEWSSNTARELSRETGDYKTINKVTYFNKNCTELIASFIGHQGRSALSYRSTLEGNLYTLNHYLDGIGNSFARGNKSLILQFIKSDKSLAIFKDKGAVISLDKDETKYLGKYLEYNNY